eukprot:gb/GECG01010039.1/.p1 GENE.gb/GECG01010039.1/~~gb/GECG01010039.1/.p1  ORF type:complete len:499 (+),score=30.71 gb/GECG01010039.1/:1-1497(+)
MDNTVRKNILAHALRRSLEAYGLHALFTLVSTLYRGRRRTTTRTTATTWTEPVALVYRAVVGNPGNLRFAAAVGLYSAVFGVLRHELLAYIESKRPSPSSDTGRRHRWRPSANDEESKQSTHANDSQEMLSPNLKWVPTETLPALAASLMVIALYAGRNSSGTSTTTNGQKNQRHRQFELNPLRFSLDLVVRAVASYSSSLVLDSRNRELKTLMRRHGSTVFFVLGCHEIMYDWFYHPQVLPKLYREWISSLARIDERLLEVLRGFKEGSRAYGTHANDLEEYCRHRRMPPAWGDPGTGFIPCSVVHSEYGSSCTRNIVNRWAAGFASAMRLYMPLQFAAALVSAGIPNKWEDFARMLQNCSISSTRSSAFLASFIAIIWSSICTLRNLIHYDSSWGVVLGSFLCGFSILLERPARRSELSLYVIPRAIVSFLRRKTIQDLLLDIRGRCVLGAIASMLFAKVYLREQNAQKPCSSTLSTTARTALKWLLPAVAVRVYS